MTNQNRPHSLDEEQHHILQIMQDDDRLADMLTNHHKKTSQQLVDQVYAIVSTYLVGKDGKIDPTLMLRRPTIWEIRELREYINDGEPEHPSDDLSNRQSIANQLVRTDNRGAIAAVVFSSLSKSTAEANNVMADALNADLSDEMTWQQGNVKVSNREAKQIVKQTQQQFNPTADGEANDATWKSNDVAYAAMYASILYQLRKRPQPDEFYKFLKQNELIAPKSLVKAKSIKYDGSPNGVLQRQLGSLLMGYRTNSAKAHSELKLEAYAMGNIDKVIIVNEFGACAKCQMFLGKAMRLDDARNLLPIHPNCRCELAPFKRLEQIDDGSMYNDDKKSFTDSAIQRRSTINVQKFNRHVPGTKEYEAYRNSRNAKGLSDPSELTIDSNEAQALIRKFGHPTETRERDRFTADDFIGFYVDPSTKKRIPTKDGTIQYGKTGAHITPNKPRKEK